MRKRSRDVSPAALAVSIALHGAILCFTSTARPVGTASAPDRDGPADVWTGDTFDVELVRARQISSRGRSSVTAKPSRAVVPAAVEPSPRVKARPPAPGEGHPTRTTAPELPSPKSPAAGPSIPPEAEHAGGKNSSAPGTPQPQAATEGTASSASPGGTFGAVGQANDVRDLTRAFTRALPAAAMPNNAAWLDLPWGPGASARVTFTLGEHGDIVDFEVHDPQPPAYLGGILQRAHLLLRRGQFALRDDSLGGGEQTYRVQAHLQRRPATDDPFADPGHIMRRGFTPPSPKHPGHAYFTFASGRHVDLEISVEEHPAPTVSRTR